MLLGSLWYFLAKNTTKLVQCLNYETLFEKSQHIHDQPENF